MKKLTVSAAFAGFSAVTFGAFGAHGLHDRLVARDAVSIWTTASTYHLIHALALLIVAVAARLDAPPGSPRWPLIATFWLAGIVLFSGSLYALALGAPRWLGPITPLGGLAFLVGWLMLAFPRKLPQR